MAIRPGPMELIIVLVIVMLIFGVGKLPQVGNAIGRSLREFRKGQEDDDTDDGKAERDQTNVHNEVDG